MRESKRDVQSAPPAPSPAPAPRVPCGPRERLGELGGRAGLGLCPSPGALRCWRRGESAGCEAGPQTPPGRAGRGVGAGSCAAGLGGLAPRALPCSSLRGPVTAPSLSSRPWSSSCAWGEAARRASHAQLLPVLPLYVSASRGGGTWKSPAAPAQRHRASTAAPRGGVGRPQCGRGAATARQCPRTAGPDSRRKGARLCRGTGVRGALFCFGHRPLVTWRGCHFVARPPFRAAALGEGRPWRLGAGLVTAPGPPLPPSRRRGRLFCSSPPGSTRGAPVVSRPGGSRGV